jgi:hypothetical protein
MRCKVSIAMVIYTIVFSHITLWILASDAVYSCPTLITTSHFTSLITHKIEVCMIMNYEWTHAEWKGSGSLRRIVPEIAWNPTKRRSGQRSFRNSNFYGGLQNYEKRLLTFLCLSFRLPTWNNSAPPGRIFAELAICRENSSFINIWQE